MKRLLMATAAVIALAIAAPIATAQYTTAPPATTAPVTPVPDDPATPQDESLPPQPGSTLQQTTPPATEETVTPDAMTTTAPPQQEMTHDHTTPDMQAQTAEPQPDAMQAQAATPMYADDSGMGPNVATPASLEQHARDAGMDGLPMTAQEVCMPRNISLTTRGASLNRDKEHMLINAADRASVCEVQRITISSPNGRADEAQQLLIDHGIDAGAIEVVDGDASGLEVQMNFAGIATSSEQYAQMFSTQQLASYQPSAAAPSYQPATPSPSPDMPDATAPAPDTGFQTDPAPADTVPGRLDDPVQPSTPNPDPADNVEGDPMSPTSGQPAVGPELLDT